MKHMSNKKIFLFMILLFLVITYSECLLKSEIFFQFPDISIHLLQLHIPAKPDALSSKIHRPVALHRISHPVMIHSNQAENTELDQKFRIQFSTHIFYCTSYCIIFNSSKNSSNEISIIIYRYILDFCSLNSQWKTFGYTFENVRCQHIMCN